jgi:hypothetical protein
MERDDQACPAAGRRLAVTLQWPPAPPEHLEVSQTWAQREPPGDDARADGISLALPDPPTATLSDPRLIGGVAEIAALAGARLDDGASAAEVMPVIRETARRWLERQVRAGLLPASAGGAIDGLARAVHDQRYGLGPVTAYLRDPQVENVDVNGCDQVWVTYASGERVAAPPVAATDDALISMIRTWATRGGQTARDFSAAAPLVNVALAGNARLTATMAVTPRPCVSLRRHGQLDATLAMLARLGTIDATLAAFLAAAVKSRCNIIITGGVNCGKTTFRLEQP